MYPGPCVHSTLFEVPSRLRPALFYRYLLAEALYKHYFIASSLHNSGPILSSLSFTNGKTEAVRSSRPEITQLVFKGRRIGAQVCLTPKSIIRLQAPPKSRQRTPLRRKGAVHFQGRKGGWLIEKKPMSTHPLSGPHFVWL